MKTKYKNLLTGTHSEKVQQDLIGGIATALGYKQNAQAFYRLYEWLKQQTLSEQELFAAGMQAFGFFTPYYQKRWEQSEVYCRLNDTNQRIIRDGIKAPSENLVLSQIRPLNHPLIWEFPLLQQGSDVI